MLTLDQSSSLITLFTQQLPVSTLLCSMSKVILTDEKICRNPAYLCANRSGEMWIKHWPKWFGADLGRITSGTLVMAVLMSKSSPRVREVVVEWIAAWFVCMHKHIHKLCWRNRYNWPRFFPHWGNKWRKSRWSWGGGSEEGGVRAGHSGAGAASDDVMEARCPT